VSRVGFFGILFFSVGLHAQISASHGLPGPYSSTLLTASGDGSIEQLFPPFAADRKPISGVVSLHELQHPISKKAIREAYEAQKLADADHIPKAIAKLERAIRIAPQYRDAHVNLGVLYARMGRIADARVELQKALDIGPPAPPIYIDLALTSVALSRPREAETWARKALELDPENSRAKWVLQNGLTH
jgi:tetratricopeptide (TPR) repeat protein